MLIYKAPILIKEESGGLYSPRVSRETRDLSTIAAIPLVASFALLFFILNGLRITRFFIGNLGADTRNTEDAVASASKNLSDDVKKAEVVAEGESPEAITQPRSVVSNSTRSREEAVYLLQDIPPEVITDALAHWPRDLPKPQSLSELEFASRRIGRGNYPWTLKFTGIQPVKVSYGGYAKEGATVIKSDL